MRVGCLVFAAVGALACQSPAALPSGAPIGGTPRFAPVVPDAIDHAAADLAAAALTGDPAQTAAALGRFENTSTLGASEHDTTGLGALAEETANAVLFPGRAGRDATARLLERPDVDAATRERLERTLADDPLLLAEARLRDARFVDVARVFNAVSAPVGRSISNATLLPYSLGRALARVAIDVAREDPLPLRRRQALAHWKEFRRRYPDAAEAADLDAEIADYQQAWHETQHDRALGLADDAHDDGRPRAARLYALRAQRHQASEEVRDALDRADAAIDRQDRERAHALTFEAADAAREPPFVAGEREAVLAALGAKTPEAAEIPALADVVSFRATTRDRDASESWEQLTALATDDTSVMARHATALLQDPVRNARGAFEAERTLERRRTATYVLLGPLASGPSDAPLGALEYLLDLPSRVQGASLLPFRLVGLPWRDPTRGERRMAVHARRALETARDDAEARRIRAWLLDFESRRGNAIGALRLAEAQPDFDEAELDALRDQAAEQALGVARAEQRRDLRGTLLTTVARSYPESRAGAEAGRLARELALERGGPEIRLSRGFLLENPGVTGPRGLDLAPALLDERLDNGELHTQGVVFVGGRDLLVHVVAAGEDEDAEPETLNARLSKEHLGRLVARLEETSFRNSLLDTDDALEANPQRDVWFERARLGLDERDDAKPGSEARFDYRGMRERYGMVRSRESILPVELVLQGSLADLTLGAFPRLRPPRETPDAVLYRE
ncbi:MAG: hypothetical protein AAF430_13560 [Myxococcota bacterium]